jgi:hypothetical protein
MSTRILIQLDGDPQPSVFDRVVAVDAGVQQLFCYGGVTAANAQAHVHGAIFTRGPKELHDTAIFIGGSDVEVGELILARVTDSFLGPLRVSVMLDANGANTTAAAAVLAAARHLDLAAARGLVLGGTGPVGRRAARLLARQGASVRLASRSMSKAQAAAESINKTVGREAVTPCTSGDDATMRASLDGIDVVIAAGAAGVQLLAAAAWTSAGPRVAIDLNAVPPPGIEGIEVTDKARERSGAITYGAIGVGGTKMKIHRAAVAALFEANDRVLDAEEIYALGEGM